VAATTPKNLGTAARLVRKTTAGGSVHVADLRPQAHVHFTIPAVRQLIAYFEQASGS